MLSLYNALDARSVGEFAILTDSKIVATGFKRFVAHRNTQKVPKTQLTLYVDSVSYALRISCPYHVFNYFCFII